MIALLMLALRERRRAYAAIALLCLAIGVLAALGAAYPRSVADSIAEDEIRAAPASERLFSLAGGNDAASTVQAVTESTRRLPDYTAVYAASVSVMGFGPERSALVYRENACAHVRLLSGRCPLGAGEVIVPAGPVQQIRKIDVGSRLLLVEAIKPDPKKPWEASNRGKAPVDVVGVYQQIDPGEDYWGVRTAEDAAGVSVVLTRPETLNSVPHNLEVLTVTAIPNRSLLMSGDYGAILRSKLDPNIIKSSPDVQRMMDRIAAKRKFVETMTPAVVLPVLVLGCWGLFLLISGRLQRDRPEVGIQGLRGLPLAYRWLLASGATGLLAIVATPLGALLVTLLTPGADGSSMTAGFQVLGVELLVIGVTALGVLRLRPLDLLRRVLPTSGKVPLTEIAVLTVAGASFAQMQSGDRTGLGIFTASLLAVAVAVVAARLLPTLLRPAARRVIQRGRLARGVALALLTRRPSGRHLLALTSAAAALFTLVVGAMDVSSTARHTQIDLTVGADRVLQIESSPAQALTAVRQVDPDGRFATVAGRLSVSGASVLAVDLSRASVMRWSQAPELATSLRPGGPAPIEVGAGKLEVTVDSAVTPVDNGPLPPGTYVPASRLFAVVELPGGEFQELDLDKGVRAGAQVYAVSLPPSCAEGCRMAGLSLVTFGAERGNLAIRQIAVDGKPVSDGSGWHTPGTDAGQWSVDPAMSMGQPSYLLPPDVAPRLPMAYTRDLGDGGPTAAAFSLRGSQRAPLAATVATDIVPRVGHKAMLVDMPALLRATLGSSTPGDIEVWLTADAPADVEQKLTDAGLSIVGSESRADAVERADRTPSALTLRMQLWAAAAGVLLLLGVLLVVSSGDRRTTELAGLRQAGVRATTLRRAKRATYVMISVLGVLIGVVAAAVAWAAARTVLPIVDGNPWLPPPSWPGPVPLVAAVVGIAVLLIAGTHLIFVGDRREGGAWSE
ncbi:hypothetical protein HDA40_003560 [Hamadaea flava]|uniref:FtsX-like permease family protein n=1 Tax=Hamadaea flava TaxID=1742688 RepID=A0ABV8LIN1_9ACTN|nr:hypothetical protein [Hamadaea flava]MCP2325053.1 hypothetical protein [Hamadaea flava]